MIPEAFLLMVPAAARPDPARREGLGLVAWQHSVGGPSRRRDTGSGSRAARRRIQGRAGDEDLVEQSQIQ
ncbi:hypothetical protein BDA96_06G008100 [Sorghum bicolor]|uniref:Uncharacterized protein n=1 Tax=Sorghum bicolor TaxID=4558 RepID=A0A921QMS3_SORBI|nr:hypothetical protein BDA96_06G008100 [Sorghum bicolor]